jgi:HlyD family secretion protein
VQHDQLADVLVVLDDEHANLRGLPIRRNAVWCRHSLTVYGAKVRADAALPACHRFFIRRPQAGHERTVFTSMKRRTVALVVLLVAATITVGAFYSRRDAAIPELTTAAVTRGPIVSVVSATGTVQPVTTVQVGSQVSGIVESLSADFNSIVHKGQVVARLDQSTFLSSLEQARANLVSAQADAERLRVARDAANTALVRAQELAARQLLPAADLQAAQSESRTAAAQVAGADARVQQAKSAVQSAEVTLAKTVIASPIDGVVTARNVDVGQTVSASMSAPTIFIIAADLERMQVNANIDESDLGQIAAGQDVSFHVDAYPAQAFAGTVSQVRLNPTTVNNVVTYAAIIDAPNPELKLKPGMTANVSIEVARRDDVLRVPAAALRFKPDAAVLAQFAGGASTPARGATVWVRTGDRIAPVALKVGATDGTYTEAIGGSLPEGALVVTRATGASATTAARPASTSGNPLLPSRPPGR